MAKRAQFAGFDDLAAKLKALKDPKETGKALAAGVRAAMREPLKTARANAPVGTVPHTTYKGRLVAPGFAKRSVRLIVKKDRSGQKATATLGVRAEAFYALQFLEIGTRYIPARPWLRPAFAQARDPMVRELAGVIDQHIATLIKKAGDRGDQRRAEQLSRDHAGTGP